jgi:hypothetical protein
MSRLSEGRRIGGWTCLRPLGAGGNADVWEAEHEDGRRGAIKVVRDQRPNGTQYARFVREIETLRRLTPKEGVVGVLDYHLPEQPSKSDFAWLVMPVAQPLRAALHGNSVADVVAAFADVARTLANLHAEGLAHRDIKPANFYWHEGRAAVGDFGLVELPDVETLQDGRIPGAFGFIADEVLADPAGAEGARADVFALAKSLWVILAGQEFPPQGHIAADRGAATLSRRLVVGDVEALDRIIDRATAPVQIRLSMRELADELDTWSKTPSSRELPADTVQALQQARNAMQETFTERDAERARASAFEEAYELVRERSDELFAVMRELDQGAEIGPFANGLLHRYTEVEAYGGGPVVENHAHWGARVENGPAHDPRMLLIDFGVGIDTGGTVHLAVFALAGDERTAGNTTHGPVEMTTLMGTIQLEHAVDELIAGVTQRVPALLEAFADAS